jgi:hydrogenase maturation protein HypF
LTYNREIYNRADDSVAFVENTKPRLIRRSRGYVPSPVRTAFNAEGIFAAGAELVNCFALGKGRQAILSQHIGDLQNLETYEFYIESITRFKKLFRSDTTLITHDLHPDYLSTKYALETASAEGIKTVGVQHHHAHIASCMAEHSLDEKVIGFAFDGTGLGDDNTIWGGEVMICDLESYERQHYLDPVFLPGGDGATKNPWRTALSYLYKIFGKQVHDLRLPFLLELNQDEVEIVLAAIDKRINSPITTSMGRLFDAVAALTGICTHSMFHAEAPMRLEQNILPEHNGSYPVDINKTINSGIIISSIVEDIKKGVDRRMISARFHNTVVNIILAVAEMKRQETGINTVVLSGGTFQNRYLLRNTENKLNSLEFDVYAQEKIPSNDGGIALGQLAIAAKRRENEK